MISVRRSSAVVLASTLAIGSFALVACGQAQEAAKSAVSSAASAALDQAAQGQLNDALGDLSQDDVKAKVCGEFSSNADALYQKAIDTANEKKAGAGDLLKNAVSLDQFKSYVSEKCA